MHLNSSACLTEVSHLLVDTQFDVRNACIVQSFLQVWILHLLRITELLHKQYQTLSAALFNHVSYELTTTVLVRFRIVQKYFVIDVSELFSQCSNRIQLVFRSVYTEGTCLMCYIICSDSDVVLFEDRKQLRIITDNTGGNNLGSLPVTDRKFSQLCVQLVQLCSNSYLLP